MTLSHKIVKGSSLLASGQVLVYLSSLIRNIIFARMLSKGDFGITAAISLGMTLFEFSGKLSIGQQLVQSEYGNDETFQSSAHMCQFLSGCFSAILIALLGKSIANLFNVPNAAWAFSFAGIFCFLNGLKHLDAIRLTRSLNYKKSWIIDVIPNICMMILAYPSVLLFHDYKAVIFLLSIKTVIQVVLSHVVAERRYKWGIDKSSIHQIINFGTPLILNSFLIFGYQQADQAVVGAAYSMSDLAAYSLAFSLTMVPGSMMRSVVTAIMLPLLSRVQANTDEFTKRYRACLEFLTMGSIVINSFLILAGEWLIIIIFGSKYTGCGMIVTWLATANALRLIRTAPAQAAMSLSNTFNNAYANFFRVLSLPLVLTVAYMHKPPTWIAACGFIGELLALYASVSRLKKTNGIAGSIALLPTIYCIAATFSAILVQQFLLVHLSRLASIGVTAAFCFVAFLVSLRSFKSFHNNLLPLLDAAGIPASIQRLIGRFIKLSSDTYPLTNNNI